MEPNTKWAKNNIVRKHELFETLTKEETQKYDHF